MVSVVFTLVLNSLYDRVLFEVDSQSLGGPNLDGLALLVLHVSPPIHPSGCSSIGIFAVTPPVRLVFAVDGRPFTRRAHTFGTNCPASWATLEKTLILTSKRPTSLDTMVLRHNSMTT